MSFPSRKLACGAIGRYDRDQVLEIATRLEGESTILFEDRGAMLVCDRDPIRWAADGRRGFAWSERVEEISGAGISDWREAACTSAACGLVIDGRRAYVHSSVAGVAPVYYMAHGGAIYFATTVDALAMASPRRLSVDWEAWATILTIDYPLGDRTPFAEIRLLPPFSTLEARWGKARVKEERWPWADVEPNLDVAAGAPAVLDAMRDSITRLPPGPIVCHLSGGLDSRLCLGLLSEQRHDDLSTLTVDPDKGTDRELRIAARVAEANGFPHQAVAGAADDYWRDLALRSLRVDYQFPRSPWRMPKLAALRNTGATSVDGFGFDFMAGPSPRFFTLDTIGRKGDDATVEAVWEATRARQNRRTPWMVGRGLGAALWASSHRQFIAESERFRGHPARAVLTFWRTRQARAISTTPYAALGAEVPMAMPLVDDAVSRASLAISYEGKRGGRLYDALFDLIDPRLLSLPSTSRDVPPGTEIPRRNRSASIADAVHTAVTDGPLAPWIKTRALRKLTRHRRGREPRTDRAAIGIVVFHQWCERYRHVLGEIDVADGIGVAPEIDQG